MVDEAGLVPDEIAYTALMDGFCGDGDLDGALRLHDEMVEKGLFPDVVTYSVLINGLNRRARTKEAKRLVLMLFYNESVPNEVAYGQLIESSCGAGVESAVALLKGFCMKGLMEQADRVFETFRGGPDEAAYNVIVHGHCRAGNLERARELYREMLVRGFVPHAVTLVALIKALSAEGMGDEASRVVSHALKGCDLAEAELSKVVVEMNHKEGNVDAVLDALAGMASHGFLPSTRMTGFPVR